MTRGRGVQTSNQVTIAILKTSLEFTNIRWEDWFYTSLSTACGNPSDLTMSLSNMLLLVCFVFKCNMMLDHVT